MFTQPQPGTAMQLCPKHPEMKPSMPRHPAAGGESLAEKHSVKGHNMVSNKFECPKILAIFGVLGVYSEELASCPSEYG